MCWIGLLTKNKDFAKEKFENAWSHNSDGGGFMYAINKELFVEKGFVDFESFWESYSKVTKDVTRVVHFRKSSSGEINQENCHPFYVNKDLAFVHNGTILGLKNTLDPEEVKRSDTYLFNEKILKPLIKRSCTLVHSSEDVQWLISRAIDKDKLVFLNKYGRAIVVNSHHGTWIEEKTIWYSNYDHNYKKTAYHTGYQHNGTGGYVPRLPQNQLNVTPFKDWLKSVYNEYCDSLEESFS